MCDCKNITNPADFVHYAYSVKNGLKNYHDEIGARYIMNYFLDNFSLALDPKFISDAVEKMSDSVHTEIEAKMRRSTLKLL